MKGYIILEAPTAKELAALVDRHISETWHPFGGPFVYSWAPGHGPVHQSPFVPGVQDGWLYLTFCQAMVLEPKGGEE